MNICYSVAPWARGLLIAPIFAKVKAKLKFYFDGKPDRYILVNANRFRFAEKWISGGRFEKLTDFRQLYYDGDNFEQEVLNDLKKLKTWNPAIFRGRPVKTQFMIPITFKLARAEN